MMHAYLISGSTAEKRADKIQSLITLWNVAASDVVMLENGEEEHTGIKDVRAFQKRLQLTPFQSPVTVGIIRQADKLTPEAQNALLKLLEEPPPHARILCETQSADVLLPTVVSRCELVSLTDSENAEKHMDAQSSLEVLLSSSIGRKLTLIDTIAKDRTSAKLWTAECIAVLEQKLNTLSDVQTKGKERVRVTKLIRKLITALSRLEHNVNPRLVLDNVFLSN